MLIVPSSQNTYCLILRIQIIFFAFNSLHSHHQYACPPCAIATLRDQDHYIILTESYTGKLEVVYHSIPHNESPEIFMFAQGQTYAFSIAGSYARRQLFLLPKNSPHLYPYHQLHITNFIRIATSTAEPPIVVTRYARDTILMDALRERSIFRGPNHTAFWAKCENQVLDEEHNEHPKVAMLTRLEDRMVAARVFRILARASHAVSLTGVVVAVQFLTLGLSGRAVGPVTDILARNRPDISDSLFPFNMGVLVKIGFSTGGGRWPMTDAQLSFQPPRRIPALEDGRLNNLAAINCNLISDDGYFGNLTLRMMEKRGRVEQAVALGYFG
ncbi:hypothetical protein K449DRAFT_462787 [Hypoxylon sp. EC38]|nr:hypothetical protein K449DRAFT_462787 [Hypoxylon sp. EC38]